MAERQDYTLLPDQLSFAVYEVCDVTGKEALDKPLWEVNKKPNMLVFMSWGREAS